MVVGGMVRWRLGIALSGVLAAFLQSPDASAKPWLRGESEHFVLYSNLGQADTRNYLRQLEAFNYLSNLLLGTDPKSAPSRTVIH